MPGGVIATQPPIRANSSRLTSGAPAVAATASSTECGSLKPEPVIIQMMWASGARRRSRAARSAPARATAPAGSVKRPSSRARSAAAD